MEEKIVKDVNWISDAIEEFAETAIKDGVIWRESYSEEDRKAVDLLKSWMDEAGMETRFDGVGNMYGRIEGGSKRVILTGSHRDTVKNDGKYGGALGLLCSLAAVTSLYRELGTPKKTVEVVATVEEEGGRFLSSYTGSRAMAGTLSEEHLAEKDHHGVTLKEALEASGYWTGGIPEPRDDVDHFIELSPEQGRVMERSLKKVGLVTSIVGLMVGEITIKGEQNHAGTTPMSMRYDPVPVAAEIISQMTRWAKARNDRMTCTFGNIEVHPGNPNIIADRVKLTFDFRSTNENLLNEARSTLKEYHNTYKNDLSVDFNVVAYDEPAEMDFDGLMELRDIASEMGMKYMRIDSGAGHDAQIMQPAFPTNMIFVPSRDGTAHSPLEYTSKEDIEEGYMLLREYLKKLAW